MLVWMNLRPISGYQLVSKFAGSSSCRSTRAERFDLANVGWSILGFVAWKQLDRVQIIKGEIELVK